MRIVVAMSGGVDSSVAAALLAQQGHEVIGLSMQLYDQREGQVRFGTCCTIDDLHDARRVAARIGIPHYIVNFEREFDDQVISNFVREYASGRTPIPCVHCNGDLKFATLAARAEALDARFVATGHYARVDRDATTGQYQLMRGLDPAKDQSYFLFTLDQAQLAHAMFPVGAHGQGGRPRSRARARSLGRGEARQPRDLLRPRWRPRRLPRAPRRPRRRAARSRTPAATSLGRHDGVHHFTVGQRKGLGLSSPIRLYVVGIDAAAQTVTVGPREALERHTLDAIECELDCRRAAGARDARHRADPASPPRGRGHGLSGRRRHGARDLRRAAARRRARPGGGVLR